MQLVVFKIREEFFGVEASKVLSINDMMSVTKVPNAPKYIKGLINLRGIIISLLDISILLNLPSCNIDNINEVDYENSSIIILDVDYEEVGIIVDKVDEVLDIDQNFIKKSIDNKLPFVKGVLELNYKLITLIDINKFVSIS